LKLSGKATKKRIEDFIFSHIHSFGMSGKKVVKKSLPRIRKTRKQKSAKAIPTTESTESTEATESNALDLSPPKQEDNYNKKVIFFDPVWSRNHLDFRPQRIGACGGCEDGAVNTLLCEQSCATCWVGR
jgi:hypothetical protein